MLHHHRASAKFPFDPAAVFGALERSIAQLDSGSYPPFNIVKDGEDAFHIEFALAGFTEEDISITIEKNTLTIEGKIRETEDADGRVYLHRGIAQRGFRRSFQLADHVVVEGAEMTNGMLFVKLRREVPEAALPRSIAITRKN